MTWHRTLVLVLGFVLAASAVLSASSATAAVAVPSPSATAAPEGDGREVGLAQVQVVGAQRPSRAPDAVSAPLQVPSIDQCSTVRAHLKELAAAGKTVKGPVACAGPLPGAQHSQVPGRPEPRGPAPIPKAPAIMGN